MSRADLFSLLQGGNLRPRGEVIAKDSSAPNWQSGVHGTAVWGCGPGGAASGVDIREQPGGPGSWEGPAASPWARHLWMCCVAISVYISFFSYAYDCIL